MTNQKTLVIVIIAAIVVAVLVGGVFALTIYERTKSVSQASYPLNLDQLTGTASLNGVPIGLTLNHGQLVQIIIFVIPKAGENSNPILTDFINTVGWTGTFTNSTYAAGQTIIMYRIYQDGYVEKTSSGILLTQQMLFAEHPRGLGESGPIPQAFFIPTQQWSPVGT